jgi:hypothetical protein
MSILKEKPSMILSIKHTLNKFVLIFVLIVKWDFPKVWPDAFSELLSLMTHTQDIELQNILEVHYTCVFNSERRID